MRQSTGQKQKGGEGWKRYIRILKRGRTRSKNSRLGTKRRIKIKTTKRAGGGEGGGRGRNNGGHDKNVVSA